MKIRVCFSFVLLALILPQCEIHKSTDCTNSLCTDEFRSVTIHIKYATNNNPVILSDYKVIRTLDNQDITRHDSNLNDNNGYYIVVDDSSTGLLRNCDNEVEFQGFIGDQLKVQKRFIIRPDCCHVYLVSGETEVYI